MSEHFQKGGLSLNIFLREGCVEDWKTTRSFFPSKILT